MDAKSIGVRHTVGFTVIVLSFHDRGIEGKKQNKTKQRKEGKLDAVNGVYFFFLIIVGISNFFSDKYGFLSSPHKNTDLDLNLIASVACRTNSFFEKYYVKCGNWKNDFRKSSKLMIPHYISSFS